MIGSEAMDFVLDGERGGELMEKIVRGIPWNSHEYANVRRRDKNATNTTDTTNTTRHHHQLHGSNDDITVVVKLCTPRTHHLISICMTDHNFHSFLTNYLPHTPKASLHSLDSLGLATTFLHESFQVFLIDTKGAAQNGRDVSDVVACDVLGAECTPSGTVVGNDGEGGRQ